ncbi:MAG TPA: MFS transporter [Candidatus Eremiobacteraceae bacterium]|nr:MFS transporter [Candidatus Eremiobacteraceae bacterium]
MKRRALSLLSLGHLTVDVTGGALVAMLPYLQGKFALSYLLLAAVSTTYQVTSSITQPVFGVISDRGAKRFLIPMGVLLAAGGFAVLGLAPTYPLVLAAVAVTGVGSAIFHPEATKSARFVSGAKRATGMSFFTIGGNIGVALGPLVVTAIVVSVGQNGTWIYLIPGAIVTAMMAFIAPAIERAETAHIATSPKGRTRSRRGAMAMLIAVVALRSTIYSGMLIFVPLFAVHVLHQPASSTGLLLFAILGAGAASTVAGGAIADRAGNKRTMLASLACVPFLLVLYVLSPGAAGVAAVALAGACIISTTSITVVMAQDYMPSRLALAASLVIGFTSGLGGLAVAGLGHIADVFGLRTVLWLLVGVAIAGTALTAMLPRDSEGRSLRREETRALPEVAKPA